MNEDLSNELPSEMAPPAQLEDRVVERLHARRLLRRTPIQKAPAPGWRIMRYALATAAGLALVAFGVLIGREDLLTFPGGSAAGGEAAATASGGLEARDRNASGVLGGSLTGAENNLYALLLYETPGYDRPGASELHLRYDEYSEWVADASARDQFVTGEDLDVDRGWRVRPAEGVLPVIEPTGAQAPAAPLSGVFFVRADTPEQALDLASSLPHVRHGGEVIVQRTIPTITPPP